MSLEPYLRSLPQLQHILAAMANDDLEWIFADREKALRASAEAKEVFGLEAGDSIEKNSLLTQVRDTGNRVLHRQRGWRGDDKTIFTVVGVPLRDEFREIQGLFFYAMANDYNPLQSEHILHLLQEMNSEQDLQVGLNILTQRSLGLFQASMAGIWLRHEGKIEPLAVSSVKDSVDRVAVESQFTRGLQDSWQRLEARLCSEEKVILHEIGKRDREGQIWSEWDVFLRDHAFDCSLCVPLWHFGKILGVLILFGSESTVFNQDTVYWLEQLVPLISGFVYDYQLRLSAVEQEQASNLLLRGTEILVQADSEEKLLTEAGEMAMEILFLEAGFFLMQEEDSWQLRSPFGRLSRIDDVWKNWVMSLMKAEPSVAYTLHSVATQRALDLNEPDRPAEFLWRSVLIQPIKTHAGIGGELWLFNSQDKASEYLTETLAAFARALGIALETIRQRRELERLATTDRLTGILNRQGFDQHIHAEIARTSRSESAFLLLILDLDGFKQLNDSQGHPAGDQALKRIALGLSSMLRGQDIVARTGGDEFSVVLTDLRRGDSALRVIERMREGLHLQEFNMGVSIGAAEFPTEAGDYEGLYRLADQRLYEGKYNGKGQIVMGMGRTGESFPKGHGHEKMEGENHEICSMDE